MLKHATKEQREIWEKQRKLAIEKTKQAGKDLRQDWDDEYQWLAMFSFFGFQKPYFYLRPTTKYIKRYLAKVGLSVDEYKEATGLRALSEFMALNPLVPLWVHVGYICEIKLEIDGNYHNFHKK